MKSDQSGMTNGWQKLKRAWALLVLLALCTSCGLTAGRRGMPAEVENTLNLITSDIAEERYEKIYNEASELWRQDTTLEGSISTFKTLRARLGQAENRMIHSATEQHNSGGPLKGRVFIVTYQTKFEKNQGMETFTLVDRNGEWLLARYFVNSTALQ